MSQDPAAGDPAADDPAPPRAAGRRASGADGWQQPPFAHELTPVTPDPGSDPGGAVPHWRAPTFRGRAARPAGGFQSRPVAPPPRNNSGSVVRVLLGVVAAIVVMSVMAGFQGASTNPDFPFGGPFQADDPAGEQANEPATVPDSAVPVVWSRDAADLRPEILERPELADARFVGSVDGTADGPTVIDAGDTWVAMTADQAEGDLRLHALDAETGEERWAQQLDNGLCAGTLLHGSLVCASSLDFDDDMNTGSRWLIQLVDPASGDLVGSTETDAYIDAISVTRGKILLVEQRPATSGAVLTGLTAGLEPAFELDLAGQEHASEMLTPNGDPTRVNGPAGRGLGPVRVRAAGDQLTAVAIGNAAAFVDVSSGSLAGLRPCTLFVNEGTRLWCNEGSHAQAYDQALQPLVKTASGVQLVSAQTDLRDAVTPALFAVGDELVAVDPRSGRSTGSFLHGTYATSFSPGARPHVSFTGGLTIISGTRWTVSVDASSGKVLWQNDSVLVDAVKVGHDLALISGSLRIVTGAKGKQRAYYNALGEWGVQGIGDNLAHTGLHQLARFELP